LNEAREKLEAIIDVLHELSPGRRRSREPIVKHHKRSHSVEDRIVSLSQPHVRPIVRGKVNAPVEFGATIAISLVDGYARMEKLSWDNFNESMTLKAAVDAYVQRYGCYPVLPITLSHQS